MNNQKDQTIKAQTTNPELKIQAIEEALHRCFNPKNLTVYDESQQHAGHVGAIVGELTHIKINISAISLENITRVEQHRKIYMCLADAGFTLHAISIRVQPLNANETL